VYNTSGTVLFESNGATWIELSKDGKYVLVSEYGGATHVFNLQSEKSAKLEAREGLGFPTAVTFKKSTVVVTHDGLNDSDARVSTVSLPD
jgi:hypothetical protein